MLPYCSSDFCDRDKLSDGKESKIKENDPITLLGCLQEQTRFSDVVSVYNQSFRAAVRATKSRRCGRVRTSSQVRSIRVILSARYRLQLSYLPYVYFACCVRGLRILGSSGHIWLYAFVLIGCLIAGTLSSTVARGSLARGGGGN